MRRLVIALLTLSVAGDVVLAQPRGASLRLTCREAMDLVKREGETMIALGNGPPERTVRDRGYCELSEIAELRFVPTRDNPQCPIGYRCREPGFGDWNWE